MSIMERSFNITGACNPQEHYMVNLDSRLAEIKKMVDAGKYFVINRGRQYGKKISMPSNDKNITEEQKSMVKASQAITLLLGPDNKLYYYEGEPNYKDYTSLKETTYGPDGLRSILLQKNATAVNKVRALKQQKLDLKISDEEYKKQVSEIKSGKDTPTVIIKATDDASYMNLIDALDEMQICNIGKYVITDIAEADRFLIKNFDSKGELSQNIADK